MKIYEFMDTSRKRAKYDKHWLREKVSEEASGILEQYEVCFGRKESLETIIKNYPYSPIRANSRSEFLSNSTAILLGNLDDLNHLLGTCSNFSETEIRKSTNVGYLESIIDSLFRDPRHIIPHIKSTGTHLTVTTGNVSYFNSKKELFTPKKERTDAPIHEWCHKILEKANPKIFNCNETNEGIAVYSIGILKGKYGKKTDLDTSIAQFNCLDYGYELLKKEDRQSALDKSFGYFKPFPNLSEKKRIERMDHAIGYTSLCYEVDRINDKGIISRLVDEGF